jgi:hypothetical protein
MVRPRAARIAALFATRISADLGGPFLMTRISGSSLKQRNK